MRGSVAATAAVLAALMCAGCSSGSSPKPAASPARTGSGLDAAGYLYQLEGDKHSRPEIDELLATLGKGCSDDLGVLVSAASVTAVDVTDGEGAQTTYGVLEKLAGGLPGSGRLKCQERLPAVEKQLKASR